MSDKNQIIKAAVEWYDARSKTPLVWDELATAEYNLAQAVKMILEELK